VKKKTWIISRVPKERQMPETPNVLIVDDDEDVRQLYCDIIELIGFTPKAVADGVTALQQLKSDSFSLVVLDMRIPDMNGLETFKGIRQFDSNVPVVLTTGFGMDENVKEALSLGALLCLEKPFNVARAMKTLREIVEKEGPGN
jgi:two-component system C4-dicarboxylate transport response regulator DctD